MKVEIRLGRNPGGGESLLPDPVEVSAAGDAAFGADEQPPSRAGLGVTRAASVEVRAHRGTPAFKLYVLNGVEAFFGFYPVMKHRVTAAGKQVPIYDVLGKDATLFHFAADEDGDAAIGAQYVEQARAWFDSTWSTIAKEYPA
jgi:hypothetical protein